MSDCCPMIITPASLAQSDANWVPGLSLGAAHWDFIGVKGPNILTLPVSVDCFDGTLVTPTALIDPAVAGPNGAVIVQGFGSNTSPGRLTQVFTQLDLTNFLGTWWIRIENACGCCTGFNIRDGT